MIDHKNKMLEYLFYLFLFLLPWQTVFLLREVFIGGEKWQYGTAGIYTTDILIVVILIFSLISYLRARNFQFSIFNFQSISNFKILKLKILDLFQNSKFKIQNYSCFMLIAWSFLSILWSPDKILAFYFSLKLLLAIGLFFTVKSASWRIDWKKIIFILMLAGTLQGALAIGQFLTQQDFASVILGTSQHEVFAGGTSVVENQDGRWLRAYGTFSHPNMLGGYLAIVLLLALWQELKYIKEKKYLTRIAGYIIIFSGLILSFSRSAWLIFAIGLFLIFISQKEKCKELKKIIFIFFLTALIWLSAFSPLFFSRVSGEDRLEQKSIDDRAEYVWQAKEIIKNNFWLGVGAGNYTWEIYKKNNTPIWSVQPVHNVFLLIFAELGVVGFLLFLTLLWQIFKKTNTKLYFLLFAFFILMFFDHWLWTSHFGILFFFLVMGIITKKDYNLEKIV